jgi:hypothetical protein
MLTILFQQGITLMTGIKRFTSDKCDISRVSCEITFVLLTIGQSKIA